MVPRTDGGFVLGPKPENEQLSVGSGGGEGGGWHFGNSCWFSPGFPQHSSASFGQTSLKGF